MDQWTPRVTARRELAELLKNQPERVESANLLDTDLNVIIDEGLKAEKADAEQKEQLAEGLVARTEKKEAVASLLRREQVLRSVVAAVVDDLLEAHQQESMWLSRLSFARFRLREIAKPKDAQDKAPGLSKDEEEEIHAVERVEREDQVTRARNLGKYCRALLRPGREAIVACFDTRRFGRAMIEQLASDAESIAQGGRNVKKSAEATKREAEAAGAQKKKWSAVRRLVRRAVSGDKDLEAKYAQC